MVKTWRLNERMYGALIGKINRKIGINRVDKVDRIGGKDVET